MVAQLVKRSGECVQSRSRARVTFPQRLTIVRGIVAGEMLFLAVVVFRYTVCEDGK